MPEAVADWAEQLFVENDGQGARVVALRRVAPPVPDRYFLHGALFLIALFSAMVAGGFLDGVDAFSTKFSEIGGAWVPVPTALDTDFLWVGLPFAIGFVGILLGHELGHYFAARFHRVPVSLPYFIPFPPYFSIVGTLGAFIRLRGPMVKRSVLFDVGVAGPIVSFLMSVPVLMLGLGWSDVVSFSGSDLHPFLIRFLGEPMRVGTSPLLGAMAGWFVPEYAPGATVALHPLAFAGWLGIFVTALNLLPLGQLDGGHVLYAVLGKWQRWVGWGIVALMIPLGFGWRGWWLWGGIAVAVSRGRVGHPPVLMDDVPIGPFRKTLGWVAILVFLLTFSPAPLSL